MPRKNWEKDSKAVYTRTLPVCFTEDQMAWIEAAARYRRVTRADVIRDAIDAIRPTPKPATMP